MPAGPSGWIGRPGAPPLPLLRPDLPAAGSRADPTLKRPHHSVRPSPPFRGIMVAYWRQAGLRWARASGGELGAAGQEVTRARGGREASAPKMAAFRGLGPAGCCWERAQPRGGRAREHLRADVGCSPAPARRPPETAALSAGPLPFSRHRLSKWQVTYNVGAGRLGDSPLDVATASRLWVCLPASNWGP